MKPRISHAFFSASWRIMVKEGGIYVELPITIKSARVLKELERSIPEKRLKEFKAVMEKLYPHETKILDQTLSIRHYIIQ